jgi:hypothetical protein
MNNRADRTPDLVLMIGLYLGHRSVIIYFGLISEVARPFNIQHTINIQQYPIYY